MPVMLDEAWRCRRSVALRPEPFGALAYHFGNRKLTFLKRPELVARGRAPGRQPDVRDGADARRRARGQHAGVRRRRCAASLPPT